MPIPIQNTFTPQSGANPFAAGYDSAKMQTPYEDIAGQINMAHAQVANQMQAVQTAKQKQQQDAESFEYDKKIKELQINKAVSEGKVSESMANMILAAQKEAAKQQGEVHKAKEVMVKQAEQGVQQKAGQLGQMMQAIQQARPQTMGQQLTQPQTPTNQVMMPSASVAEQPAQETTTPQQVPQEQPTSPFEVVNGQIKRVYGSNYRANPDSLAQGQIKVEEDPDEKLRKELTVKKEFGGTRGTVDPDTVSEIADGVQSGITPPDLKGLYRYGGAVRGELAKRGFNLTKATKDWQATQKWVSGVNSTQQIRMRQALNSVSMSVPELRNLSDEFKRTGWTPANGIELKLALTGTDPSKRDMATKFISQVNLMKDELAQGFMGGGVPTDRAFALAEDILNPLYGKEQLDKALDQLEFNLNIRDNAITSVTAVSEPGQQITPPQGMTSNKKESNDAKSYIDKVLGRKQ